jgi:hypothetical protein
MCWLNRRYRRQASSHIFDFLCGEISRRARFLWESGLPAMAVCQSMNVLADPALSQASQPTHFDLQ